MKPNGSDVAKITKQAGHFPTKLLVGSLILGVTGCAVWFGAMAVRVPEPQAQIFAADPAPQPIRLSTLDVVVAGFSTAEDSVKATGQIYPAQEAAISAQVSGLAESVAARPGDEVISGDFLAGIGTTDLQLQLDQQRNTALSTKAQVDSAQANFNRTQALSDKGLAAQTALESARLEVDQLAATLATQHSQVKAAEINLARARISAPISGAIASRTVEPGQVVSSGTPIFTVVDMSTVRVEMLVSLRDAPRIALGQTVILTVQGVENTEFSGAIDRINPIAEAGTRSVKAYLTLDNASQLLRGGMVATASIIVRRQNAAILLPKTSIRSRDNASYVLAVVDHIVEERPVQTGGLWGSDLIEINSGVAAGDVLLRTDLVGVEPNSAVLIEAN